MNLKTNFKKHFFSNKTSTIILLFIVLNLFISITHTHDHDHADLATEHSCNLCNHQPHKIESLNIKLHEKPILISRLLFQSQENINNKNSYTYHSSRAPPIKHS